MAKRGIATTAIHAGEKPDPVTGASSPNLVMASTFASEEPIAFSINSVETTSGDDRDYVYTRWGNPTIRILEDKLAALEGAEAAAAFASGMAATSAILLGKLSAGDHLLAPDVHYPGSAELVRDLLPRFGIQSTVVNTANLDELASSIRPNTKVIFLESPANPILKLTDVAAVCELARQHGISVVVDATLATPIGLRPIELGADFVVHSLTKYIGGHGDALGGVVAGKRDEINYLKTTCGVHFGGTLSPFNAWLIARGALSLTARMTAHEAGALHIARFLENHPQVVSVNYPGLDSHPQHSLAKSQLANYGGLLSFQVRDAKALIPRMAKKTKIIHFAVSLGHIRSLISYLDTDELLRDSFNMNAEQATQYRQRAGDGIFRLSVGLEDPEDLCQELAIILGN